MMRVSEDEDGKNTIKNRNFSAPENMIASTSTLYWDTEDDDDCGNRGGIATLFREQFSKGPIYDMVDPLLKEEIDENNFTLNRGPCQESLDTFSKLAYECLSETHEKRPTTEAII
nr:protein kinase, ATP binding site-containing protein [Tanacetum cinerariifolium]